MKVNSILLSSLALVLASCGNAPSLTNLAQHGNLFGPHGTVTSPGTFVDRRTGELVTKSSVEDMKVATRLASKRLDFEVARNWDGLAACLANPVKVNGVSKTPRAHADAIRRKYPSLIGSRPEVIGMIDPKVEWAGIQVPITIRWTRDYSGGSLKEISLERYRFLVVEGSEGFRIVEESVSRKVLSLMD